MKLRCDRLSGGVIGRGSKSICKGEVRIYRFYNYEFDRYGEPFALCETHRREQLIPQGCHLDRLEASA